MSQNRQKTHQVNEGSLFTCKEILKCIFVKFYANIHIYLQ